MSDQHKVYLAVPGVQYCWGTVTGVINSTRRNVAMPYNGGLGFSGVEDFNVLWGDAHERYDRGEVTHFAMLHGDLYPDPDQRWLDILLEEMDARGAELVSALSPIKDGRGLASSGIADLDDPWMPWRRFTFKEIWQQFPETFDARSIGYPDRPLLHNTGCWVCDLRKPVFQAVRADGLLDLFFRFPDEVMRRGHGDWHHRRQSEDWLFSRELWLRGARNTWITRRVGLEHEGKARWTNKQAWGSFTDGDENTANKWRAELEAKPLSLVQLLEFELGTGCNLGQCHPDCPNTHPGRYALLDCTQPLEGDQIVQAAVEAYRDLGFFGFIGWIYYNEPLCQAERMFRLMGQIKERAPQARFILWSNGTLIPEDCASYKQFEQLVVTNYGPESQRGIDRLRKAGLNPTAVQPLFDDRINCALAPGAEGPPPLASTDPCLRPFVELIFDHFGNSHLCCYDWQGQATFGNLHREPLAAIAARWRAMLPAIAGQAMAPDAPAFCRGCGHRWANYQQHDGRIVARARRFREALTTDH